MKEEIKRSNFDLPHAKYVKMSVEAIRQYYSLIVGLQLDSSVERP